MQPCRFLCRMGLMCKAGNISQDLARQNLETQIIRDKIKKEYCIKNNIPFLEVWQTHKKSHFENIKQQLMSFIFN